MIGRTRPESGLAARPESGLRLINTALNFWQKIQNLKLTGNTTTTYSEFLHKSKNAQFISKIWTKWQNLPKLRIFIL